MKLSAIVVDDSLIFRKVVRDSLQTAGDVDVVAVASNGALAVERILARRPDLVTLDIEMPEMDGLQVLRELKPYGLDTKIIMVSSLTQRGAAATTRALALGAFDFILKPDHNNPAENIAELRSQLAERIRVIRQCGRAPAGDTPLRASPSPTTVPTISPISTISTMRQSTSQPIPNPMSIVPSVKRTLHRPDIVVIGVSTGGPQALRTMIGDLSPDFSVPIVIVQHMPAMFTASMAGDINQHSRINVCEAANGDILRPGWVYVAPGGKQLRIAGGQGIYRAEVTDDAPIRSCKPSVDYLFDSVAGLDFKQVLAIIMTGMGDDGLRGCQNLKRGGSIVWAQDEATSTVYGMPRQIVDAKLADRVLTLDEIAPAMMLTCGKSRPPVGLPATDLAITEPTGNHQA